MRQPSGFSATFAVASSPPSSRPRGHPPRPRPVHTEGARHRTRPQMRPGVLVSTAGTRVPRGDQRGAARWTVNGWSASSGCSRSAPADAAHGAAAPASRPRQVEVLRLLEQGRSTKQIAAELHLSTETVRNHVRRLFRALGVQSRDSKPSPPPGAVITPQRHRSDTHLRPRRLRVEPRPNMAAGRWYPSVTPLHNGEMLITSGRVDTPRSGRSPAACARSAPPR